MMAAASWSRSTYPLNAPFKGSASVTPSAEEAEKPFLDRLPRDGHGTSDAARWYRSVTEDRGGQDLKTSQQRNESFQSYADSSTAVSLSQASTTPPLNSSDWKPWHGGKAASPIPVQLLRDSQVEDNLGTSPWTRNEHPMGTAMDTTAEYQSPVSIPASTTDEEPEQVQNYEPMPDHNGPTHRKLRRTPRSRRIISPVLIEGEEDDSASAQPAKKDSDMAHSGAGPWRKSVYPLQATAGSASTQLSMSTAPPQQPVPIAAPESPKPIVITPPPALVATPQHPIPTASNEVTNRTSFRQPEGKVESNMGTAPQNLQTVPQHPDTGHSKSENEAGNLTKARPYQSRNSKGYPLQSMASVATLRNTLTPPPSPTHRPIIPAEHVRDIQKVAPKGKTYPLQSPASITNFQKLPPPSPKQRPAIPSDRTANVRHAPKSATYPLQSPASIADFQNLPPPSPPQSPSKLTKQSLDTEKPAPKIKTYPLQSHANIARFQNLQTPSEEVLNKMISANQAREIELATKVIKHWKRQVYPLQNSPPESPGWKRSPQDDVEQNRKPRSIHLPKHIRAVKDAEKSDESPGRTIVVLLDGTGDKFDNDNSNIVHLVSALKKDDPRQVTYYQAGIGTYGAGGLSGGVSAAMDMAVGSSLGLHVRDAYHFLMHTYKEGDKICIFSFSRGAYTARCLAGMIHKVGLLPPRNIQQISFAYEFYKNDTEEGWQQSMDFKRTFCIDVCVYFLGCFDSVASVGIIPRQLPLSSTPTNKSRYFRHAMALDERRAKFKVCRHQEKTWDQIHKTGSALNAAFKSADEEAHHLLPNYKNQNDTPPKYTTHKKAVHGNLTDEEYFDVTKNEAPFSTDVLEVWFAGAHADIGGGAVLNSERHKLAQIPLRWMIRQAFECNTGIIFRTAVLAEHGLDVHTLWPKYSSLTAPTHEPAPSFLERYEDGLPPRSIRRSKLVPIARQENGEKFYDLQNPTDDDWTPEQVEDFFDAISPLNDQLIQAPNWWILEFLPVEYKVPLRPGEVQLRTGMNLGRYRGVEDIEPNVHWTVLHRMKHIGYNINVRTAKNVAWKTVV